MSKTHGPPPEPPPPDEDVLPHDLAAEAAVLGAILLNNAVYVDLAADLRSEMFYRRGHRLVYEGLARLLEPAGGAADFVLLRADLDQHKTLEDAGGPLYVSQLTDGVPKTLNARYYAAKVRDKALARGLIAAGNSITRAAYSDTIDVRDQLAAAEIRLLDLRDGGDNGLRSMRQLASSLEADFTYRMANKGSIFGVPSGFATLDTMLGGWKPGNLVVVAARPGIGKTAFALNAVSNAAFMTKPDGRPFRAVIFSMEMEAEELQYRWLSALSGVPLKALLDGMVPEGSPAWDRVTEAFEKIRAADVHIDDTSHMGAAGIRAKCRRLQAEGGLDLVVADYVQLMADETGRRGANRNDVVGDTSRKMKVLAGELGVPIMLLSQLSRASAGRSDPRPHLTDLRESGSLEQDASVVMMLHRPHASEDGSTEALIRKNRNGPEGTRLLTFLGQYVRFEDGGVPLPEPTKEEKAVTRKAQQRTFAAKSR